MRFPRVCVFGAAATLAAAVQAATFTVVNTNDSGAGSLRQAITDANATPGSNIVIFNVPRPAQITLTSALPALTGNLRITTNPRNNLDDLVTVARSGASDYRIFTVTPGSVVQITGLVIFGGRVAGDFGGGILNDQAILTVRRCVLTGNTAAAGGAIFTRSPGELGVIECAFTNNVGIALGGAIVHESSAQILSLEQTELSNNNGDGAAIVTAGPTAIGNCTFANNISNPGRAGGVMALGNSAVVHISNCTMSENTASAAGGAGAVYLDNGAQLDLQNTIFKRGATGANLALGPGGGFIVSAGNNISDDAANGDSGTGPGGFLTGPQDRRNTDALLGPLTNLSGLTRCRTPLPGSPAIDTGADVDPVDQRGLPRPLGAHVDIGAIEVDLAQVTPALEVNTSDEHNDGLCGIGDCTLWEAIDLANANPNSVITLPQYVVGTITTRHLPDGLEINAPMTVRGPGARLLGVSGENVSRIFKINAGVGSVVISDLILAFGSAPGGASGDSGSAIWNKADLTVERCSLVSNRGTLGGAIYNDGRGGDARLTLSNCSLFYSSALRGGAIYNDASSGGSKARVEMTNCTLFNNFATATGGAIHNNGNFAGEATVLLTNTTIHDNTVPAGGGSIYNEADFGTGTISAGNTIFSLGSVGPALVNHSGTITSRGGNLCRDAAGGDGTTGPGGFLNGAGDIRNTNPQLGTVSDNGGPTDTLPLLPVSPARDSGNNAIAPPADQRGYGRNGVSDIGAFEFAGFLPATLANISTRLRVETGDNVLIAGFIVTGSENKKVIVRAIGPSLNLPGQLSNPTLELYQGSTLIASNDDWQTQPATDRQEVINSTIPPTNALEAALVRTLPAGGTNYTAIVRGVSGGTGIGVVEVYDLDRTVNSKLANISTRGLVQTGDNVLIAGTIVLGTQSQKVIVRAIGPSLPLAGTLANPTLELRDRNGAVLEANDDWTTSPNRQAIIDSGIPPTNDVESAIVRSLPPDNYTAIVRGVGNSTGIAVVEVYALE